MNMLGIREPGIYGSQTLDDVNAILKEKADGLGVDIDFFQSNIEGEIVNQIHASNGLYDGIVINPGAFTHYSYAIRDAISAVSTKVVEVHISNVNEREEFRHKSVTAPVCIGQIAGFGINSYYLGIIALVEANK